MGRKPIGPEGLHELVEGQPVIYHYTRADGMNVTAKAEVTDTSRGNKIGLIIKKMFQNPFRPKALPGDFDIDEGDLLSDDGHRIYS